MSGTPEIEAPGVGEEQQPSPTTPTPPLAAFGGAVVGSVIEKFAKEEYLKSVEATANQANAEYQNFALEARQKYLNLYGDKAIAAHPEVVKEIQQKRQEMMESLTSLHARRLFADNTQRVMRLAQESVDSHFVQQSKAFQFGSYQKLHRANTNTAAALAVRGNLDEAYQMVDKEYENGIKQYTGLGLDSETAAKMAEADRNTVANAILRALAKPVEGIDAGK